MEGLKIVNIGGGSLYTPDFGEELEKIKESFPVREWVLMDIDEERLKAVGVMTEHAMKQIDFPVKITHTTNLQEAVKDANFVFTTFRVGGTQGRIIDEKISEQNGLIGQETTPPGGLAMALRNVPVLVEVARAVEELAHPGAWLINLANPAGLLTEAVHRYTNCNIIGLCNWPTLFYKGTVDAYGVDPKDVFLKFVGVNHMNWADPYVKGKRKGVEAFNKFVREGFGKNFGLKGDEGVKKALDMFPSPEISDFVGWPYLPAYMKLYYETDEVKESKIFSSAMWDLMKDSLGEIIPEIILDKIDMTGANTRGEYIAVLESLSVDLYDEKNEAGRALVHSTRGGGSYAECGIAVANAIHNNTGEILVVDHPNWGTVKGIDYDDVIEGPCVINGAGAWPVAMGAIPTHMTFLIQEAKHYEKLTAKAAMEGNYHAALEALVISPLLHSYHKSRSVLDDLLVAHKEYLPNFSEVIAKIEKGERPF